MAPKLTVRVYRSPHSSSSSDSSVHSRSSPQCDGTHEHQLEGVYRRPRAPRRGEEVLGRSKKAQGQLPRFDDRDRADI